MLYRDSSASTINCLILSDLTLLCSMQICIHRKNTDREKTPIITKNLFLFIKKWIHESYFKFYFHSIQSSNGINSHREVIILSNNKKAHLSMSFFIVTFPTAGVSQDELAKLTHIGSYRLKSNLTHQIAQKNPHFCESLNLVVL